MRQHLQLTAILASTLLTACLGNKSSSPSSSTPPPPTVNTMTVTVDGGPAAAPGQINVAYVTVRVCAAGSTQCANIDHVRLDTGSWGLRLLHSVLTSGSVTLTNESDAQGQTIEECVHFSGGQTWGPVALADVTLAGEVASKVPVQVLNETGTGASPPGSCGVTARLNDAISLQANGILGVGVFVQDCGQACANAATPLPTYYGCTAAGVCTAENVALADQVTNPVAMFAADNNGIIINMPNLINANGDASAQGELTFGIGTQADNPLPAGLTVLGADANGDFTAKYNGSATSLPALIDSGTDSYAFNDPTIATCSTPPQFIGYYCPTVAPLNAFTVNSGVGTNNATNTVNFAIADANTFVLTASAFSGLAGGGGSTSFTWGMPFFYGRKVYIGIDQRTAGGPVGPYYAY